MIAIVIASHRHPELFGLDDHLPLPLFPLVDRPLLHHIVEYLVELGIRKFEFILSHLPDKIEAYLGDGTRWGCSFRYHLIPAAADPNRIAYTIAATVGDRALLGRGDCLPEMKAPSIATPAIFVNVAGERTGWAALPDDRLTLERVFDALDDEHSLARLPESVGRMVCEEVIDFRTGDGILLGQRHLLQGQFTGLMIGGRQSEPGIWLSRNVTLHPTVVLTAPLFIGANCRVGRGARVGPSAIISANSILDSHTSVRCSVVAPGTYVGQALELDQVLVDRNRLVNVRLGTSFLVSETFLLSALVEQSKNRTFQQLLSKMVAIVLLIAFAPAALIMLLTFTLTKRGKQYQRRAVSIPVDEGSAAWREYRIAGFQVFDGEPLNRWAEFLMHTWPGLLSVVRGDLSLVGVQPRSRTEIEHLPSDWRSIYLKSRGGLITEAAVMFGETPSQDDLYTAEAYYGATETLLHDVKLLGLFFWQLIFGRTRGGADLARVSR